MNYPILAAGLLMLAGCSGGSETTASKERIEADAPARGASEGRAFTAIEIDAMRPAFAKETVIKLNAIVRRSLDTANEFTRAARAIRASVDAAVEENAEEETIAKARQGIDRIENWHQRALSAQADMNAAVGDLKNSDEIYNEEILAGMLKYVNDVERMLREESQALSGRLEAARRN